MFRVNGNSYSTSDFIPFLSGRTKVQLSRQVISCIKSNRKCLEESLANGDTIYGVNTGFGALSQVKISENDQKLLQLNLVRSHSAGTGTPFSPEVVRLTMVLKLLDISFGYSGVRLEVAKQLMDFLNHDILPVVPSKGSVGASGDLAQLSHIALALIGEGDVQFEGRVCSSIKAIKKAGLTPLTLHTKEGLTLVNGTQVSTALGVAASCSLNNLLKTADIVGALSVEASLASRKVFRPAIHRLKKHPGQILVSRNIWNLLAKSEIVASHRECGQVQDPYSLRCIPHVHGSSREVISPMIKIIENEINSVSDNPLVFSDSGKVESSGHFHAEPVAQAMDAMAISTAEIGAISERRIAHMMEGKVDHLPNCLASVPGLESGYMMLQVTAGALASENKTLATPASVDSIPTAGGQEDLVSMAPWAGQKLLNIIENVEKIIAVELLTACRALEFHKPLKPAPVINSVWKMLRRHVKMISSDHLLSTEIETATKLISSRKILSEVELKMKIM